MPDTKEKMHKVKVLMGRGQDIEEDEAASTAAHFSATSPGSNVFHYPASSISKEQLPSGSLPLPVPTMTQHYPVAAYRAGEIEKDLMTIVVMFLLKKTLRNCVE
jgi:hypothetical protein